MSATGLVVGVVEAADVLDVLLVGADVAAGEGCSAPHAAAPNPRPTMLAIFKTSRRDLCDKVM